MAAGSIAGTLPAGILASRRGLRFAALTCFFAAILVFSLRAVVLAVPAQVILAFAAGATLSIWAVCISPMVAHLTSERSRPFAFSLIFSSGIGTVALGNLIGGSLPGLIARQLHVGSANRIVLLLCCAIVCLGLRPLWRLQTGSTAPVETRRALPRLHPFLFLFLPVVAVWGLVTGSFAPFANVYFARHLHMPLAQIGVVFSAAQIAQVAAVLLAPLVFRRFGLISGIIYMQIATGLALASLAAAHGTVATSFLYVGYTAFQWMNEPGLYSLLMDRVPQSARSDASAWNVLVASCSQAVAATLAGSAFLRFNYPTVMVMIGAIALLAACSSQFLLRARRPDLLPAVSFSDG
jgi:predicted MFS family arabinose efflux permease